MKSSIHLFAHIISNSIVKLMLFISLILLFFTVLIGLNLDQFTFFESLLTVLTNRTYYVYTYLLFFLIIAYSIFNYYKNNLFQISRINSKKDFIKNIINDTYIINNIFFLIFIISTIVLLLIFRGNDIYIIKMKYFLYDYNISNIEYIVFHIFKMYCIMQLSSILSVLLFNIFDYKLVIFLNVILYCVYLMFPYKIYIIKHIFQLPIILIKYIDMNSYSSFNLEVIMFLIYILLFAIANFIIYKMFIFQKKGVCE